MEKERKRKGRESLKGEERERGREGKGGGERPYAPPVANSRLRHCK